MTSLAQSTASWTSRFHTDYVMHLTRVGRFVFFTVLGNVEHIGAIWQFMEVFLRFRCLKLKTIEIKIQIFIYNRFRTKIIT